MAARDIRALPKLEGTVHVNIALINKFIPNYFFNPQPYPEVPRQDQPQHDRFLFDQGPARGLGRIRFHDYGPAYDHYDLPNVHLFKEQDVYKRQGPARGSAIGILETEARPIPFYFLSA